MITTTAIIATVLVALTIGAIIAFTFYIASKA